jgi:hypothetical protein
MQMEADGRAAGILRRPSHAVDRAEQSPVHNRQRLHRLAHLGVAELHLAPGLPRQIPHHPGQDLRGKQVLGFRKRTGGHRLRDHFPHLDKGGGSAQSAHAGDDRVEQAEQKQAEVSFLGQLGGPPRARAAAGLQAGQKLFPKTLQQLPMMKFLFGKWQHWLRHATSKPYPAKKYKLQSGDNLVSNILQASAPPSIPPSALNLPNTTAN